MDRAAAGEEIVIAKSGRPLGLLAGQVRVGAAFDDPLPHDVMRAFEGLDP